MIHCYEFYASPQFLLGVKSAPRETENNAYVKFWGDKQRALWYVIEFLEWSISSVFPFPLGLRNSGVQRFSTKLKKLVNGKQFPFETSQSGKRDYLFRISVCPGNFPVGRTIYIPTGIFSGICSKW